MIRWDREPDPAWTRELARLAPPREHLSHLCIHWVPFAEGRYAHRWVIFDCVPMPYAGPYVSALTDEQLKDPLIRWCWHYFHRTGAFPFPVWVCQGGPAGHPVKYSVVERELAKAELLPPEPAPVGALPYHEPTSLTWEALWRRSLLHKRVQNALAERERVKEEAARTARAASWQAEEDRLSDVIAEGRKDVLATAPRVSRNDRTQAANVTNDSIAEYIQTGVMPHPVS